MVNKCVAGCRFNYLGGTKVPAFSFLTKDDLIILIESINKSERFVKDWRPLYFIFCLHISHFEEKFFKKCKKIKELSIDKFAKVCAEYLPK